MASTAAHLVDRVLPEVPIRHWVLSLPIPLRFLAIYRPVVADDCLRALTRTIFEVLQCDRCGGRRKVLALITDPMVIAKILECLGLPTEPPPIAGSRAGLQTAFEWN